MHTRGYPPATPCWSQLVSTDLPAAKEFYCGVFGWQLDDSADITVFRLGGDAVAGAVEASTADAPSGWITHISTQDIDADLTMVEAAGGEVLSKPVEVPSRGRSALVGDDQGAVFALWEPAGFQGAQVTGEPGATCWSDLRTRNPQAAEVFYERLLGWSEQAGTVATDAVYSEWAHRGRVVAGMVTLSPQVPAQVPAHWQTHFEVDDCEATVARCVELGGSVLIGPLDVQIGHYAQIRDPQGGMFGAISLVPGLRS